MQPYATVNYIISLQGTYPSRNRRLEDASSEAKVEDLDDEKYQRKLGGLDPFIGEISNHVCRKLCPERLGFLRWSVASHFTKLCPIFNSWYYLWRRRSNHVCIAGFAWKGSDPCWEWPRAFLQKLGRNGRLRSSELDCEPNA